MDEQGLRKTIYLTIDDGPSADMVEKVDYLSERGIPAVFFCIGEHLQQRPGHAIHAIQKGFVIGNHSTTHPHFSSASLQECCREIEETDRIIDQLYNAAGQERPAKWFRFPYGDKGDMKFGRVFTPGTADPYRKEYLQSFLRELGYRQPAFEGITYPFYRRAGLLDDADWHWTFDLMEYATLQPRSIFHPRSLLGIRSLSQVLQRMEKRRPYDCRGTLPRHPRWLAEPASDEIVLLHDHEGTTAMFPQIVERLVEKPIRFGEKR
jgi:peptidoglycan-N-acetylglucosamine deacetylase